MAWSAGWRASHPVPAHPPPLLPLQRIMEIRGQIAKEWIEELELVGRPCYFCSVCVQADRMVACAQCLPVCGPCLLEAAGTLTPPLGLLKLSRPPALMQVDEENAVMMRETVLAAFSLGTVAVADPAQAHFWHSGPAGRGGWVRCVARCGCLPVLPCLTCLPACSPSALPHRRRWTARTPRCGTLTLSEEEEEAGGRASSLSKQGRPAGWLASYP